MHHPEDNKPQLPQSPVCESDDTALHSDTFSETLPQGDAVPPVEDIAPPQGDTAPAEDAAAPRVEEPAADSRWYGVAYPNQGGYVPPSVTYGYPPIPMEPPRKSKGKRIAIVALLLAACMVVSVVAGFVGSVLGDRILEAPEGYTPGNAVTNNGSNNTPGEVYSSEGADTYAYADVTLQKNDGSTLVGSVNGSAGDATMGRIAAIAAVKDAVVEIMTTTTSNFGAISAGAGSGVIVHADGIIVTNHHVIAGATTIRVRLTNGNTYEAVVRGTDEEGDIAVIKIQPRETLTVAKLGYSGALALGEEVIAIGNPLGELGGTVTDGIISALQREVKVDGVTMTLIQTNAAINSGNSGGGLFNLAGELIGVVNAKYAAEGVEGLGFAIPIDTAVISIQHLLQLGYIPGIPALGVEVIAQQAYLGNSRILMPYVSSVRSTSPLQVGDYIYSINGTTTCVDYYNASESPLEILKRLIRACEVGDTVNLVIYRNGSSMNVSVELVEYIPENVSVDFE